MTEQELSEFYGEPISIYTAEQAVEDGVLVDIRRWRMKYHGLPIQYVTRTLWDVMEPFMLFDPETEKREFEQQWRDTIRTELKMAVDYADFAWEIWGIHYVLLLGEHAVWMLVNATGGWTLMLPGDQLNQHGECLWLST